jgi:hypothetical protein
MQREYDIHPLSYDALLRDTQLHAHAYVFQVFVAVCFARGRTAHGPVVPCHREDSTCTRQVDTQANSKVGDHTHTCAQAQHKHKCKNAMQKAVKHKQTHGHTGANLSTSTLPSPSTAAVCSSSAASLSSTNTPTHASPALNSRRGMLRCVLRWPWGC